MTRRIRRAILLQLFLYSFFLSSLSGCGGSGSFRNTQLGQIPTAWSKYLAVGSVGATLDIYRSSGALQTHLDLVVDMAQGTVTAPPFQLPIGDTYRFITIFSFGFSSNDAIPYAYADFTWQVDQFSEAAVFSENDIRYRYDTADPAISADLSDGKIPNLDLDGDGWSNWEELRDRVNPKDPKSVPILPSVDVRGQQDGGSNTATIVVTAKDNAHVEALKLLDPLCGATVISDTLVDNVDGSVTRTLTLRLDLSSVSKNPRPLQALASDGVTPGQNANGTLNFSLTGSASQPYFVFSDPEENAEVEGPTVFKGVACSRNPIDVHSARFLNSELGGFSWDGQRNDQTGDFELQSAPVETTLLPDGPNTLKVEVTDSADKLGEGNRVFNVVNDSQIKVASPVGRRWVFGAEQIAVTVRNLPDSNLVVIEGGNNFELKSSTSGGAVGILHVANVAEGTVVPLTFKAIRADGSEILRKVNFTVQNKPQIFVQPKASKVFQNWSTDLSYRVVNVDPARLTIDGASSQTKGTSDCGEDPVAKGVIVCSGRFPARLNVSRSIPVAATRAATSDENTQCPNCSDTQSLNLTANVRLSPDLPDVNVTLDDDDEAIHPSSIRFPADGKTYHLMLTKITAGSVVFDQELAGGVSVPIHGLTPRTDYHAVLQILNAPAGNVEQEMFKDVTTGDKGLVGWWRFDSSLPGTDFSGHNLVINFFNGLIPQLEGLPFDGVNDFASINDGTILNPASFSIEVTFESEVAKGEQELFDKRNGAVSAPNIRLQGESYPLSANVLIRNDPGPEEFIVADNVIEKSTKYHLVSSFDSISFQKMRLFLNGSKVAEKSPSAIIQRSQLSAAPTVIGGLSWDQQLFFAGSIFEISVYNRVLCDHDVWRLCIEAGEIDCGPQPATCF